MNDKGLVTNIFYRWNRWMYNYGNEVLRRKAFVQWRIYIRFKCRLSLLFLPRQILDGYSEVGQAQVMETRNGRQRKN